MQHADDRQEKDHRHAVAEDEGADGGVLDEKCRTHEAEPCAEQSNAALSQKLLPWVRFEAESSCCHWATIGTLPA